jgi:hypothetical protein
VMLIRTGERRIDGLSAIVDEILELNETPD